MTMDDMNAQRASDQLHSDLHGSVQHAHRLRRPILTHINADTTWLLSLPCPDPASAPSGRSRYNILIDPWLKGPQEDVAGWFSRQWHTADSVVQTIEELDQLLQNAEALDHDITHASKDPSKASYVDLVIVSHEFTDHCHQATLLEIQSSVPVLAGKRAARLIKSWKHFQTVIEMSVFNNGCDWRKTTTFPLPEWIGISRITTNFNPLYFHSAVMICAQQPASVGNAAEAIIYTPHGVDASALSAVASAEPPLRSLALLHGLHDVSIAWSKQLNLGAVNAVKAQRVLRAKFWIGTHDEDKAKSGVIAHLLRRKTLTVAEALEELRESKLENGDGVIALSAEPICVELRSGESILLE